ncbi:hypothetical protein J3R30DRAFT_3694404 [Lentinula aciculospora]|uniref:Uncharacterized protein n=1 Tax=Lentinula aciculospora TaxID=153920 RepID=A0A9W9AU95_9AGAR|nr:hypothetical protein J3R30DRAFT_3694404 [Lentinula aciculospora]
MIPIPSSLTSLIHLEPQAKPINASQSFALKLRAIGALSVEEFLNISEEDLPPIRYDFGFPNATCPWYYIPEAQTVATLPELTAVQQLENACKEAFGRTDVLHYSVVLKANASGYHSVLHIVRNSRMRRTYTGMRKHKTENQAREEVAQVALREGALTYILGEEPNDGLNPDSEESSNPVKMIEDCFARWRPGLKAPEWFSYDHGAALKVQITSRTFRVYSTPEDTKSDAQVACAQIAIDSGILEFIKFGDGQVRPSSPNPSASNTQDATMWSNVQEFMETIPRPFPEPEFEHNPLIVEGKILQWFNKLRQDVNKSRASPLQFYFHFLQVKHAHGCLLRVEPPNSDSKAARTYLIEPRFSKKAKSKIGVCIQAMSEGVGSFLRAYLPDPKATSPEEQSSVTLEMRRYANVTVWPAIEAACREIGPGAVTTTQYPSNSGKFGCLLMVVVPPLPATNLGSVSRNYTVTPTYLFRDDARVALLCEEGHRIFQFVKSRGAPGDPPRPVKKAKLMAVPMYSPAQSKTKTKAKKKPVDIQPQPQPIAVPLTKMAPKDWDKETNQPNVDLTYELEPGEIFADDETSVAGSSTFSHPSYPPSSNSTQSNSSQPSSFYFPIPISSD